jgi:hypothetical protein
MSIDPIPTARRPELPPVRRTDSVRPASPVTPAAEPITDTPPAEVLASLDTAARVLEDLQAREVNMRIEVNKKTNEIEVELVDSDGQILRRIPATRALDFLAGGAGSGLAVDELG